MLTVSRLPNTAHKAGPLPREHFNRGATEQENGHRAAVFDRGASEHNNPEARLGFVVCVKGSDFRLSRSLNERPARKNVTAKLCGDPAPDRVVPNIPEELGPGQRPKSPIHLTFRQMQAAYGEHP